MRRLVIIISFITISAIAYTQSTNISCLTVDQLNGAVTINFTGPSGTSYFKIYRAQPDGSFEMIHITEDGQTNTFTDNTINASSQSYSYYVLARVNGQDFESEVRRTIFLSVTNLNNGLVQINWNDPAYTPTDHYQIFSRGQLSTFELLNTTGNTQYIDTLNLCEETRYYRIKVMTDACESISNVKGGTFRDITNPDPIITENASIDINTGLIHLSWLLPSSENADISKYQIWIINANGGSTSFPEAEVTGYNNLSITLENELVCDTSLTFAVTAQDSCGNSSDWDNEEYHIRTVNLITAEYDICNDQCMLYWDSLYSWTDVELTGIRIYQAIEDGPFEEVKTVGPTQTFTSLSGFERDIEYHFYIEAFSEGNSRTSTSCVRSIVGKKPLVSKYTWLRQVSVENGEVELKWQVDTLGYIPQFQISHSKDGFSYDIIDTVPGTEDTVFTYIDTESSYYRSPQFYYIQAFDSCLNLAEESNISTSIYSQVTPNGDGEALIEWTPYSLMDSMLYYHVYRIIDTNVYPIPVGEVSPSEFSYSDYYGNAVSVSSKVGYYVEAVGYFHDSMPVMDTARSNANYLAKVTNLFVPSGFQPKGGVSNIFKPIYTGIKNTNYSFKILNKWGMLIFESNQPILGWNGKYEGEYVIPGAYVYVVDYQTLYGKKMRKSGLFYVLY